MIRRAIREYRRVLPRLSQISLSEWRDMLSAQVALLWAERQLRDVAEGDLTTRDTQNSTEPPKQPEPILPRVAVDPKDLGRARALALAVSRAASYGLPVIKRNEHGLVEITHPKCLARSMALCRMMKRENMDGEIVVGVALQGGDHKFHAWVEFGDAVLGDDPASVSEFEALGLRILPAD